MKKPLVSVVVVTRDREKDLRECIEGYKNCNYKSLEIIVVDNASSRPVKNWLKGKYRNIKVITLDHNTGAAQGRNIGFIHSAGDYIIFTDDDAYPAKGMVLELVKAFTKKKDAGIIQPLVYDKQKKAELQGAGHDINLLTGRITAWGVREKDIGQYEGIREVPLCGCVWMVKREVFDKIGGYDEDYFIPYEDSDFSLRARMAGYKLYCVSNAKTYHQGPKKTYVHPWVEWLGITSPERAYRVARNKILFISKHANIAKLFFFLSVILPLYTVAHSIIIIAAGKLDILRMYWKGVLSGIGNVLSLSARESFITPIYPNPKIDKKFVPKNYPLVSIVIPIRNSIQYLEKFLDSLENLEYPNIETIFVDDQSSDGSEKYIKDRFKRIKNNKLTFLKNRKLKGIAESRNVGIRKSSGKYIAFAEADMAFDKSWLNNIVGFVELNLDHNVVGAAPKIMDFFERDIINSVGTLLIPHTAWVIPVGVGKKKSEVENQIYPSITTGVGSVVLKSALEKINGFDGDLVRNVEDIDLGWRIWLAGYRTFYYPYSVVYHYTSKDIKTRKDISEVDQQFHMTKSLRLIYKNYEFKNLMKFLSLAVLINFMRILSHVFKSNFYSSYGIIKGMYWFIASFNDTRRERRSLMSYRKVSDKYIMKNIMVSGTFYDIYTNRLSKILDISTKFSQKNKL